MGDGARGLAYAFQQATVEAVADDAAARETFDTAELGARLAALYERGRAAHPGLEVAEAVFGQCLARAAAGAAGQERRAALEELAIEDLYLACACAGGGAAAVAAFEVRFAKVIRRAVARVLAARDQQEEAAQRASRPLLVGRNGGPEDRQVPWRWAARELGFGGGDSRGDLARQGRDRRDAPARKGDRGSCRPRARDPVHEGGAPPGTGGRR